MRVVSKLLVLMMGLFAGVLDTLSPTPSEPREPNYISQKKTPKKKAFGEAKILRKGIGG